MARERRFLSIGEVLSLIQVEFPDVTISKIRFLESQGLIDPERTPSGYRKFYPSDIERLRVVLQMQKESFLPLKVIKNRLEHSEALFDTEEDRASFMPPLQLVLSDESPLNSDGESGASIQNGSASGGVVMSFDPPHQLEEVKNAFSTERKATETISAFNSDAEPSGSVSGVTGPSEEMTPTDGGPSPLVSSPQGASNTQHRFSLEELCRLTGARVAEIEEMVDFGLIGGTLFSNERYYDGLDFEIAKVVTSFRSYGVEARHLKMFRTLADREVGFLEQVIAPYMRQRNPAAKHKAQNTLQELQQLGATLRGHFMGRSMKKYYE